jgi:predicted permease
MRALRILVTRITAVFRKRHSDAELDDEILAHLDLLAAEHIKRGMSPTEAQFAARREFGGVEGMKEVYRDQRGLPFFDALARDLRYGARILRRDPGFTTVAVISLGLGIGASTTAFGVFNAVMLRPMKVAEPGRLVLLQPLRRGDRFILVNPVFEELRRRQTTLEGLFAVSDQPFLKVTFDDTPTPSYVRGSFVSGNYFPILGLSPSLGRLLTERDDEQADASDSSTCAAVISYKLWTERFQHDPSVVRRTLQVRRSVCPIVGVAPATFASHQAGFAVDVWLPLRPMTDRKLLESRGMAFFSGVMGRLRPGVNTAQAEAELTALYQQAIAALALPPPPPGQQPPQPTDFRIRLESGAQGLDAVRREYSTALLIVMAVVGVVWLIAIVNVANLLLARGAARLPELATRSALGAGRGRLLRQLATEGCLLASLGALVGGLLAWGATPMLASLVSLGYTTIALDARADWRVVGVAIASTVIAALLAGMLPGLRLSRATLQADMARASRTSTGRAQWLARALVTAQLALSLLLVTAAGLLLRTIVHLAGIDPGFRPEHVVVLNVRDETPGSSFGSVDSAAQKAQRATLYRAVEERVNALPGVRAASISWLGLFSTSDLWLPLINVDQKTDRALGRVDYVSWRYFETMGMEILRGRTFTDRDREGMQRVGIVNQALARERFGNSDPLGHRLALDYTGEQDRPFTIIGIVRDSKYSSLREKKTLPMMWVPIAQAPFKMSAVSLRTEPGAETAVARQAQDALRAIDGQLMVRSTTTLAAQVKEKMSRERLLLGLSSAFGVLALLLASVGLYGTLAYAVSRRTRELGVRMAFGAQPAAVLRLVLGDALKLAGCGIAVGLPIALLSVSSLTAFLFDVRPIDPVAFIGAAAVLTLSALAAAYIPARRAAAVDPIVALRVE